MWNSAWALLVLSNLFWAGNIVLGRGVVGMYLRSHLRIGAGLALSSSPSASHGPT